MPGADCGFADRPGQPGWVYVPALDWTVHGSFAGVYLRAGGTPHYALMGRTFLRHFTMVYDGKTGAVTLS